MIHTSPRLPFQHSDATFCFAQRVFHDANNRSKTALTSVRITHFAYDTDRYRPHSHTRTQSHVHSCIHVEGLSAHTCTLFAYTQELTRHTHTHMHAGNFMHTGDVKRTHLPTNIPHGVSPGGFSVAFSSSYFLTYGRKRKHGGICSPFRTSWLEP